MKALTVFISVHHGNTEKVARNMANILDADLVQVKEADATVLEGYDLIGFGSGIYFGKHHKSLLGFVDKLPVEKKLEGIHFFHERAEENTVCPRFR